MKKTLSVITLWLLVVMLGSCMQQSSGDVGANSIESLSGNGTYTPENLADALSKSRLIILTGSTADIYVTPRFPDATILRVDNMADLCPMLNNNSGDFLIGSISLLRDFAKLNPGFVIADDNLFSFGVAMILPQSRGALRDELNEFIAEFKLTEEYAELRDRWLVRDDTIDIPRVESVKSNRKLVVATVSNNHPYNTMVDGYLTGFEVEMLRHFALKNGIELEFLNMNFSALISAVATEKVDLAISTVAATDERKRNFIFTDEYLSIATGVAYINRNITAASEKKRYKDYIHPQIVSSVQGVPPTVDDTVLCYIQDRIVSAVEGTIQEQYISSLLPSSQVAIAKDYADGILMVNSGTADYMLTNLGTARGFKKSQEPLEIVLQDIFSFDICYGLAKGRSALKMQLNEFLSRKREDGTLRTLSDKWLTQIDEAEFDEVEYAPNAPVLKVGSTCTAVPFSFISNGRAVGLDIEVISLFCQDAGYKLEVVEMPFGALVSAISTGKVDIIANTLSATEERREKIDFSDPYGYNCFALIYSRCLVEGGVEIDDNGQGFFSSLKASFVRNIITENRYKMILDGIWVTIIISILSIIFGTLLGSLVCSMTMSKSTITRWIGELYVVIIRGTPVLVVLMINFYVIFAKSSLSPVWVATFTFAMNFGAYVSEMFRSSITSIDRGQREAGLAMGFSSLKTFIFIIAPQAIKRVMPIYKGEAISLVKMTSIVGYVAVQDITKVGDIIRSRTFDAFFPLLVSALLYFLISYIFSQLLNLLTSKVTRVK